MKAKSKASDRAGDARTQRISGVDWGVALMLVIAAISTVAVAAPATAHTCASYDGCDAEACVEGEDHDHTDYNYWEEHESCKTTADPPPDPESCEYYGMRHPPTVCKLLGEEVLA